MLSCQAAKCKLGKHVKEIVIEILLTTQKVVSCHWYLIISYLNFVSNELYSGKND